MNVSRHKSSYASEKKKNESNQRDRCANTQDLPPHQEEQWSQQTVGLMSGDGVQVLASIGWGEELDFRHGEA